MAIASVANLFSYLNPSKPPPPTPPPRFPLSTAASTSSSRIHPGCTPLVLSNEAESFSPDLMAVVCPSLAYANTMFFRAGYNVQVIVDDNEPEERLLGRFRRDVLRAGVIQECKRRRFFENKQEEKKRKAREAAKRNRRRRPQARIAPQDKQETSKNKKDDDDEDNWDLPEGNLLY